MKTSVKKTAIIIGLIVLWQFLSYVIKNNILFVGPVEVAKRLIEMSVQEIFWKSVLGSLFRILVGFWIAFLLGYLCAFISGRFSLFEDIMWPLVSVFKSVPVASVVVLFLIWFGAKWLSVYVSFMVVFPNVYINLMEAVKKADAKMLDMAKEYRLTYFRIWRYIIGESAMPLLIGAVRLSVGMSFKSGVAAEIIGLPEHSIGEQLYMSKIYIDTAGVLSWTLVVVLLCYICEKVIIAFIIKLTELSMSCHKALPVLSKDECSDVVLKNIKLSYGEQTIFDDFSYRFGSGKSYVVTGESGQGKTSLLNLIRGSVNAEAGKIEGNNQLISMMFQEDRLVESMTALDNLLLIRSEYKPDNIKKMLKELIPDIDFKKRISEYSGGMKRRVSLIRAIIASGQVLILDEPFAGLDHDNKIKVMSFITKYRRNRMLILTSHDAEVFNNTDCDFDFLHI